MVERIKIHDLPEFDAAEYLTDDSAIAEYLSAVLEAQDASLLVAALGDIAKARGMTEIARSSGLTREALYRALRVDAHPQFETVMRVCNALGFELKAQRSGVETAEKGRSADAYADVPPATNIVPFRAPVAQRRTTIAGEVRAM